MSDSSWTIERFDELASTNDRLKDEAGRGAPGRTVVVAGRQMAGRGRGARPWTSPEGGLYCSVLLRDVPQTIAPLLAFAAGEALMRTLGSLHMKTASWLKWPNDLLIAPAGEQEPVGKAAGILVETVAKGDRLDHAIIGLGVNLHTQEEDLPGDQDPPAVSFRTVEGSVPAAEMVLEVYLTQLERVLTHYRTAPELLVRAVERRLAWIGRPVRVRLVNGETMEGTLLGLTTSGGLRLDTEIGEESFDAWDVASLDRAR